MQLNKKSLNLLLVSVVVVIGLLSFVSSNNVRGTNSLNLSILSFQNNSHLSGTITWNITVSRVSATMFANMANCTLYLTSTLTANNSLPLGLVSWAKNDTIPLNDTYMEVNGTFPVTMVEDANNYNLNVTCRNMTNDIAEAYMTGLTIDSTVPTAPTLTATGLKNSQTVNFTSTVVGKETTSCVLYFDGKLPGSASSYTMNHAGAGCSYQLSNIPEESYTWRVVASDEDNTTSSSSGITEVDIQTSAGRALVLAQQQGKVVTSSGGNFYAVAGGSFFDQIPLYGWFIVGTGVLVVVFVIARRFRK
jgi:hypothetical protein